MNVNRVISLVPADGLYCLAINLVCRLNTPEGANQFFVIFVGQVKFTGLVVLKLWMVNSFLRNAGTTPQPNTFNLEVWLVTKDQVARKAVLAEVVEALQETIAQVICDVELFAFTFVFVVVQEPK